MCWRYCADRATAANRCAANSSGQHISRSGATFTRKARRRSLSSVIYEVAELTLDAARRDEFADVYRRAWAEAHLDGARGLQFMLCVEDTTRVAVVIEWDSVEAHDRYRLEHRAWTQLKELERAKWPVPKMVPFRAALDEYVKDRLVVHYEAEDLLAPHSASKPVRERQ